MPTPTEASPTASIILPLPPPPPEPLPPVYREEYRGVGSWELVILLVGVALVVIERGCG